MPALFGRYRVVSELGMAGLAEVDLGVAPGPTRSLVRIYRPRSGATPTELQRFGDAAQLAARFDDAGIASSFEQGLQVELCDLAVGPTDDAGEQDAPSRPFWTSASPSPFAT